MKTLRIIDIGNNGEGIAKENGKVYFVPRGLIGEEVEVLPLKEKSNFTTCKIVNIKNPSPLRLKPPCPYFDKCGGCSLQHISYEEQLKLKKQTTQNTIHKISKLEVLVEDVFPSDKVFGRRNKMVFAIDSHGKLCMHDYKDGSLFEVNSCLLATAGINKILTIAQDYILQNNLKGCGEKGKGDIKYIVIRELENKFLITLVSPRQTIKNITAFAQMLTKEGIAFGLYINVNNAKGSLILTDKFLHIAGLETLQGSYQTSTGKVIEYPISPGSFMQVNDYIKDSIYKECERQAKGYKFVVDCYSGSGLMTAILSQNAEQVVGIEVVKSATQDADKLKADNNINNMQNINADCVVGLDKLPKNTQKRDFCLVLDPPRKGVDRAVVEKVLKLSPGKIIYISCNPATLARDIAIFVSGYSIEVIQPFDMFPNTSEIETFVVMKIKE